MPPGGRRRRSGRHHRPGPGWFRTRWHALSRAEPGRRCPSVVSIPATAGRSRTVRYATRGLPRPTLGAPMTYAPDATSDDAPRPEAQSTRRSLGCLLEIVETLVPTLVIYPLIHNFIAQPFEVEQDSMVPTILEHEYILIDKLSPRFNDYDRGDIVVFTPPPGFEQGGVPFIKRVIGLPGDVVSLQNGRVYVTPEGGSAIALIEPYVRKIEGRTAPTQPRDAEGTSE